MKTDIALHEIMRIDEQDEAQVEHASIADPTQADADRPTLGQPFMKSEESPTSTTDDVIVATEVPVANPVDDTTVAEKSPASRPDDTTAAQPVISLHDPANLEMPAEQGMNVANPADDTTVAEKSPASRPDDTTAAQPVISLHDPANLEMPAPAMNYDESSIGSATTPTPESTSDYNQSPTESAEEIWLSIQTKTTGFFDNALAYTVALYKNNRQLLTTLGIIFLAVLSTKLLVAGLNAIDDIPLVAPILKLIGLVYVVRFVSRYLLREQDRHELAEKIDRTKAEVFGSQN
ncbi:CAAD domain-containing protein [Chamaesiphon sp.]|uniref:CAAD domain-containing protein n=1 Tax=Chamaesiphon sp. TaxID=2814140 RepID=UPI003593059D